MSAELILTRNTSAVVLVQDHFPDLLDNDLIEQVGATAKDLGDIIGFPVLDLSDPSSGREGRTPIVETVSTLRRRTILLAGGLLEGAVTQSAIELLLEGFDVFVIRDLTTTLEPEFVDIFLDRIRSCAGLIVTRRQAILDILTHETDARQRQKLINALKIVDPSFTSRTPE